VHLAVRTKVLACVLLLNFVTVLIGKCPEAPNDTIYEERCTQAENDTAVA